MILEIEKERARARMSEGGKIGGLTAGRGRPKDDENSPPILGIGGLSEKNEEKGEAVEIAAKKVGDEVKGFFIFKEFFNCLIKLIFNSNLR